MTRQARRSGWPIVAAAVALAALLLLVPQAPAVAAQSGGVGVGIFYVAGSSSENVSLPSGGTYYLTLAPDASSFVNVSLRYNGSLMAQDNQTRGISTPVSLPAGNYSLSMSGHGRAALGWDFTDGALQEFPDNQTLVAFLVPSSPSLNVNVVLGDAQSIALRVYDDTLHEAGNATVTASRTMGFTLPATSDRIAYIVASVTAGLPNGRFGLSWSSPSPSAPIDLTAWPWFLLWILVPVAVVLVLSILRHGRGSRRGPP